MMIPLELRTLGNFCREYGIIHIKGIPYRSPSNGEVENHNQALLIAIRITKVGLQKGNRDTITGIPNNVADASVSPAELMFGRKLRIKLPSLLELNERDDSPISNPVVTLDMCTR